MEMNNGWWLLGILEFNNMRTLDFFGQLNDSFQCRYKWTCLIELEPIERTDFFFFFFTVIL